MSISVRTVTTSITICVATWLVPTNKILHHSLCPLFVFPWRWYYRSIFRKDIIEITKWSLQLLGNFSALMCLWALEFCWVEKCLEKSFVWKFPFIIMRRCVPPKKSSNRQRVFPPIDHIPRWAHRFSAFVIFHLLICIKLRKGKYAIKERGCTN